MQKSDKASRAEQEQRERIRIQEKKERKPYPRYYQNEDGTEQIFLENPVAQVYVRFIKGEGNDVCFYSGSLKRHNIEDIKNRFKPSTEAEFKKVFNRVVHFFATMAEVAPKVLREEANAPKLEFHGKIAV